MIECNCIGFNTKMLDEAIDESGLSAGDKVDASCVKKIIKGIKRRNPELACKRRGSCSKQCNAHLIEHIEDQLGK